MGNIKSLSLSNSDAPCTDPNNCDYFFTAVYVQARYRFTPGLSGYWRVSGNTSVRSQRPLSGPANVTHEVGGRFHDTDEEFSVSYESRQKVCVDFCTWYSQGYGVERDVQFMGTQAVLGVPPVTLSFEFDDYFNSFMMSGQERVTDDYGTDTRVCMWNQSNTPWPSSSTGDCAYGNGLP